MLKFKEKQTGLLLLFASLTLGLAPFTPEPHIWANLRWIAGGAVGMEAMNWADTLMHGAPWVLLFVWLGVKLFDLVQKNRKTQSAPGVS